jgi:two-component system cell cycle sensor histidine kinase/response regulator CckA
MPSPSKILIADDEHVGRELMEALLISQGYDLAFAANGSEALGKAIEWVPDLVLLDVMMPDMDGYEVCRRMRGHPTLAEVPIIMLTALDDKDSRLRGIEAGADEFISKPFDRTELRARVRTITRLNRYRGLMLERSKFDGVVEFSPDGILIVDANGSICVANPAASQMLQLPDGDALVGRTVASLFAGDQADQVQAELKNVLADKSKTALWESQFQRFDSKLFPVEISARSFPWGDGQSAVQMNVRDITEKKKLEAQFLRAQRMQSIGTLAGGIAHDLNNVLTPILSAVQLLRYKLPDESNRRLLDTLENSAERGANIIKQILAFARGREGERKILQIKYLVSEIENIIKDTFPRSIQIQTAFASDLRPVLGDATHLHQVLMNLCVNARDAMMPQGGHLKIEVDNLQLDEAQARIHADAVPGPYVVLSVSDSGSGIAPEILDKLFEPFFTTKEVGKGTGLGLSTVLGLVKSHRGFVTVESQVRKGSCFRVYLPAAEQAESPMGEPKPRDLPRGRGETILIVDDESAIREITQATLERFGYQVLAAKDAVEALALFSQQHKSINLVLTDYIMPLMDGTTYIRILQKLHPAVRITVMSGSLEKDKMTDFLEATRIPFIVKPFTAETLLTTVQRALSEPIPPSPLGPEVGRPPAFSSAT